MALVYVGPRLDLATGAQFGSLAAMPFSDSTFIEYNWWTVTAADDRIVSAFCETMQ